MARYKLILIIGIAALMAGLVIGAAFFYPQNQASRKEKLNYFFIDKEIVDSITANHEACIKKNTQENAIAGGIVNHHLLAAGLMKDFFCRVANDKIKRVIILSPNHFGLGSGWAIAGSGDWQTANGIVFADNSGIKALIEDQTAAIDDNIFDSEHGIGNLLPAVEAYFPQAKIIPLAIKGAMPEEKIEQAVIGLQRLIDDETLVIASLDFSHDLPLAQAEMRDQETLAVISKLDYEKINELNRTSEAANVDSPEVLNIFLRLMASQDATRFELLDHSNSAIISGQVQLASTTSYFTAVYLRKK